MQSFFVEGSRNHHSTRTAS